MAQEPKEAASEARVHAAPLPAWSLPKDAVDRIALPGGEWPERVTREWAWGDSRGEGTRVCIHDSGVEADHPAVGGLAGAVSVSVAADESTIIQEDTEGDLC